MKRAAKKHFTVMELAYISKFYEFDGPKNLAMAFDRHPISVQSAVNKMKKEGTYDRYRKIWDMQFRG